MIVMAAALVFEKDMLRLLYGYGPQSGRCLEETQYFYDEGKKIVHRIDDSIVRLGNNNGHTCRHIDGLDGAREGYGLDKKTF